MPRYQVDLSIYYLQNMLLEVDADDENSANDIATSIATTAAIDFMHAHDEQIYLDEVTAWAIEVVGEE